MENNTTESIVDNSATENVARKQKIHKRLTVAFWVITAACALVFAAVTIWAMVSDAMYPRKVEGDVWTYYILKDGTIALMGLNPNAVPEDGVLYIPEKIDGRKIKSFAISVGSTPIGGSGTFIEGCSIPYMQKVIVAEGVPIGYYFWAGASGRIVEFESKTGQEITYYPSTRKNIIVPDGCRELYIAAMEAQEVWLPQMQNILEKSEVTDWVVDENGLLKGYFGLESEHLVLPEGIKKIDGASLNGGGGVNPKTIILNEDLEEIGKNGLTFGWNKSVDEITIPKSVQYIGESAISAKKIFLYRGTICHELAFPGKEIIYLD